MLVWISDSNELKWTHRENLMTDDIGLTILELELAGLFLWIELFSWSRSVLVRRSLVENSNGLSESKKPKIETKIHCWDRWKIREFYFCLTVTKIIVSGWGWSSPLVLTQGGRSNQVSWWFITDHIKSNLSMAATSSCASSCKSM